MAIDRESPQAWIAAGNCFSLQKDQDEAMRCFRRATQVAPSFAYAWTLCGYEAIEMEEYERAIAFFRTAIRTETRHYNAWYGMGLVYLKTGKAKYAEHHFRRATEINPTNPVLLCCIGMVRVVYEMKNVADDRSSRSSTTRCRHCHSTTRPSDSRLTARWSSSSESGLWSLSAESR